MSDWHARAACSGLNPDDWFPTKGSGDHARAKQICVGCPVREACLEDALERGEKQGIWGGASPRRRRQLVLAYANRRHDWRKDCTCTWCRTLNEHFATIGRTERVGTRVNLNGPNVRHGKRSTYVRGDRCPACSFAASTLGKALSDAGIDTADWWDRWMAPDGDRDRLLAKAKLLAEFDLELEHSDDCVRSA